MQIENCNYDLEAMMFYVISVFTVNAIIMHWQ